MKKYLAPVLVGGLFCGLLSSIPYLNFCCCFWVIGSGMIAAYLLVSSATAYPSDGEGLLAGLGAGALGGVFFGLISFLMVLVQGPESIQEQMQEALRQMPTMPPEMNKLLDQYFEMMEKSLPLIFLLGTLFYVFVFGAVAGLGGLLGMRIFRPRRFGAFPPGMMPPGAGYPPGPGAPYPGPYSYPGGWQSPPPMAPAPAATPSPASADPIIDKIMWLLITGFQTQTGIDLSRDQLARERIKDAAVKARADLMTREDAVISLPFLAADASGPKHLEMRITRTMIGAVEPSPAPPIWGKS